MSAFFSAVDAGNQQNRLTLKFVFLSGNLESLLDV